MKKLSVIIPVYNEEKTVGEVLKKVAGIKFGDWQKEIVVVDDGSSDKTFDVLSKLKVKSQKLKVLRHKKNRGKGAAVRTGIKHASGDAFVIQDADLEYDPREIVPLLEYFSKNNCLAVYGSRNLTPNKRSAWYYYLGVLSLGFLIKLLYGSFISDSYTCYKLINTKAAKNLNLRSNGFEMEVELTVKLLKRGVKIHEIPIKNYDPRSYAEGKKIKPIDGLIGLWTVFKNRF